MPPPATRATTFRSFAAVVFAAVALIAVSCGSAEDRTSQLPWETPSPTAPPTPTPIPPPEIVLASSFEAHQGYVFEAEGQVRTPDGSTPTVTADFGDGTSEPVSVGPDGRFRVVHRYASASSHELHVRAESATGAASSRATVEVIPRKVVFIQGMNSESRCPDGDRFLDRAPAWLAAHFAADEAFLGQLHIDDSHFVYFSYSGEYCDGSAGIDGAAPAYEWGDTCESIDGGSADRLKALIDGLAPSRVTIVAHSMGGLVAAYLAASEPEWAREHIASIVTFDSPLAGIDRMRVEVLGFYRMGGGGCGRGSPAMSDLRSGSEVTRVAAEAARIVPFFTLDGQRRESRAFGIAEAVPNGRTEMDGAVLHLRVNEAHSEVWSDPPSGETLPKATLVACALLADTETCALGP